MFFFLLIAVAYISLPVNSIVKEDHNFKFVYISNLNLYPTPFFSSKIKSDLEINYGQLISESQVIFQEIIKLINKEIKPNFVFLSGNNIYNFEHFSYNKKQAFSDIQILNLLLDMLSELKCDYLPLVGEIEHKLGLVNDFSYLYKAQGINSTNRWWSYYIPEFNILFISLSSSDFVFHDALAKNQVEWLENTLKKNTDKRIIMFSFHSFFDSDSKLVNNKYLKSIFYTIKKYKNIFLVISGNTLSNRIRKSGSCIFLTCSSVIGYPGFIKTISIYSNKIVIDSLVIPLKGILKKQERSIISSKHASRLFIDNPVKILDFIKGKKNDNSITIPINL